MPLDGVHEESSDKLEELRERQRPTGAERPVAPGRWAVPAGAEPTARPAGPSSARAVPFDAPFHAGAEDAAGAPHE
jgi:hypothetical protein